jgi:hypothetical protein
MNGANVNNVKREAELQEQKKECLKAKFISLNQTARTKATDLYRGISLFKRVTNLDLTW